PTERPMAQNCGCSNELLMRCLASSRGPAPKDTLSRGKGAATLRTHMGKEDEVGQEPGADPINEEGSCDQGSCSRWRRPRRWPQPSPRYRPARLPQPAVPHMALPRLASRRPSPARQATSNWWGMTPCSTGG